MRLYFVYPETETIVSNEIIEIKDNVYVLSKVWRLDCGLWPSNDILMLEEISKALPENVFKNEFSARKHILNHLRRQEMALQKRIVVHQGIIEESLKEFDADEFDKMVNGE